MDCPTCGRGMEVELSPDGESSVAWTCPDHGKFPIVCSCGILQGQEHDVLCPKAQS